MKVEKPDKQLGFLLIQVSFLKQRIINAALRELDLTYIQFVVLAAVLELRAEEEFVTQQDVASKRQLDKAMVSNVVKSLAARDLLVRQQHPADKRAWILSLTKRGKKLAVAGKEIAKRVDEDFFAKVDSQELRIVLEQLISDNSTKNA